MKQRKLYGFTQEEYLKEVNAETREFIDDFLTQQKHLSDQTVKQYKSALMIFLRWNFEENNNKEITSLRPRDGLRFQNYMIDADLSTSAIKLKRSTVSSLYNYLEVFWADEYPNAKNIFNKAVPSVGSSKKKIKEPLTMAEIEKLISVLKEQEDYQKIAYIMFSFNTGCRKNEARQLRKEVVDYSKHVDKNGNEKNYYITHKIKCKGSKKDDTKIRGFKFLDETMFALRKWIEIRGEDDCDYVFVSKDSKGNYQKISEGGFNVWCKQFSKILDGKPVYPHLFRSSIATIHAENGMDIRSIQAMLGHNSSETTQIYIVQDEDELEDELYQ